MNKATNRGKQSADQRRREKENDIYHRGNPEDLPGDMHHGPQRAQLTLWKMRRPAASTKPVAIPQPTLVARSRATPGPGLDCLSGNYSLINVCIGTADVTV